MVSCGLPLAGYCMSARPRQAKGIVAQNKGIRMLVEGLRCCQLSLSTALRIERRDDRLVAGC